MRRDVWCLLAAVPALLAVASAGCYQGVASPVAGAAPVSQSAGTSAAPADEATAAIPATAVASVKVPEGMKAVVLAVPGMH
jgi:hypothetical protein